MKNAHHFNVFGRIVAVVREHGGWRVFDLGADGKHRPADFQIPDFVGAHELQQYLGDLFHENATPQRGEVSDLSPPEGS